MKTLREAIDALPTTPEGIAELLEQEGYSGIRDCGDYCPVARYLQHECAWPEVFAGSDRIQRYFEGSLRPVEEVRTPDHVADFIRAFDAGAYPALDSDRNCQEDNDDDRP